MKFKDEHFCAVTLYLGPDIEIRPDGVMHKYVHPDVRVIGRTAPAKLAVLHRNHLGSVYLNARYYDPHLARFISPDSLDPTLPGVGTNR